MTTKQELKQHICELREIVTKKQEWEEKYLKEEYGKGWVVMIRCQAGIINMDDEYVSIIRSTKDSDEMLYYLNEDYLEEDKSIKFIRHGSE